MIKIMNLVIFIFGSTLIFGCNNISPEISFLTFEDKKEVPSQLNVRISFANVSRYEISNDGYKVKMKLGFSGLNGFEMTSGNYTVRSQLRTR